VKPATPPPKSPKSAPRKQCFTAPLQDEPKALDLRADPRAVRVGAGRCQRGDALIRIAALQLELPRVEIYADISGD
jgi:hypothetical protein